MLREKEGVGPHTEQGDQAMSVAAARKLFVGCLEFHDQAEEVPVGDVLQPEGAFEIVLLARDVVDARERLKARLDEIARSTEMFGPIVVWVNALVELAEHDLVKGALVNHIGFTDDDVAFHSALPHQGLAGSDVHFLDEPEEVQETEAHSPEPFWSGVDIYWSKWKLFWCETEDHDEDWFIVARNAEDAEAFHVGAEGYDEDDAQAQLVCVLPAALQGTADEGWPSRELIIACGGEFLPNVPVDGMNELRARVGSGSRVVQICGRVFAEGDVVGNVVDRFDGNVGH
jgi:hypothetical protein